MKITNELIKRMELDPYGEWDVNMFNDTVDVELTGIEQDARNYFNMQPEEWPDSYVNIYAIINPYMKWVKEIEIHIVDGLDGRHDKFETIIVPQKYRKKIIEQLSEDKLLGTEFMAWLKEKRERV